MIIDYKTSKRSKTKNALKKDLQLGIYALFASIKGIETANEHIRRLPKKLSMLFLREKEPEVCIEFSEDDMVKFVEQIKGVHKKIQLGSFNARKGKFCEWCDYRDLLCPEFG